MTVYIVVDAKTEKYIASFSKEKSADLFLLAYGPSKARILVSVLDRDWIRK